MNLAYLAETSADPMLVWYLLGQFNASLNVASYSVPEQYEYRANGGRTGVNGLPLNSKITGYTKHGAEQAIGRDGGVGVSNNAIIDAVFNPAQDPIQQNGGTIKYIGKNATVVLNQDGMVVTTWARNSTGTR
jgi:hypothetical protein